MMSGSAGIRGYYYQVLAGLLESVEDDSWESIKIEPSTKEDKVDIEWVFRDSIRAVQVKSSINNFQRGMLINWVYTLVKDARSAYEMFDVPINYTLYLIGTTDRNADTWISDLRGGRLEIKDGDKLKEIESELSNVEVKKQSFDSENLEALAYVGMQEYLERNGKSGKLENIKTLCSVIVSELLKFTMQGRPLTKALFLQLINKHINSGEYGINTIRKDASELSLVFFEKGKVSESSTMLGIQLNDIKLLNYYYNEAMGSLQKARGIKLPRPKLEEEASEGQPSVQDIKNKNTIVDPKIKEMFAELSESIKDITEVTKPLSEWSKNNPLSNIVTKDGYIPVKMSDEDIAEMIELSKSILGIELTDEDFYFGGLEKRLFPTQRMFGGPVNVPRGTDEENNKYSAVKNAYSSLLCYKYLQKYNEYLRTVYPLPIIIKNTGSLADEEIQVTLKFPPTARVVTPLRMKSPLEPFIEDFITDSDILDELIKPIRDHTVMEYEGMGFRMPVLPKVKLPYEQVVYTDKDFVNHLNYLFEYEHFEDENQDIVQYEFKSLNPFRKMVFPTFLLVETDTSMEVVYMITSKNMRMPVEGTLHWVHTDDAKA